MGEIPQQADVVVLGAGLSGMSAAVEAASAGASVAVLEVAATIGGSATLSGGYVWTLKSVEDLGVEDPGEYQRHGQIVVEGYAETIAWLSEFTQPLSEEQDALAGRGRRFDMPLTISKMASLVTRLHGNVFVATETNGVRATDGGYVVDYSRGNSLGTITCRSIVFASGGRQADPQVRSGLVGGGFIPQLRGNANSRGRGAQLAGSLGASLNLANKGFYGHLYPAGVDALCPADFIALALYHSSSGVLLDGNGSEFVDESRGDHNNAMALAAVGGRGVLMWSEQVQKDAVGAGFVPGLATIDRFAFCADRGARASVVADADELPGLLAGWGYDDFQLTDRVRARVGAASVYVVEVAPAITFTFGGIEVDDEGRVIDANAEPLPGVFAAGADMSDTYHQGYGGGLSMAVVSGRRAGRLAALHARSEDTVPV